MFEIQDSKILVIGGAGFIGSYVVEELLKEKVAKVVVYDNFCRGKRENLFQALQDKRCSIYEIGGDINQTDILESAIAQSDYVIHLAALWLLQCRDFPRAAFKVNIEGAFNVLELCGKHKIKKLVYSSSASVYGDAQEVPMTEQHPFNNRNFYGATKIAGEAMCRAFYERYGLNYVGLRYMNVYGPRQDEKGVYTGVIPIVLNKIEASEAPIVFGDGTQAYDFVYVKDVAMANVLALKSEATDEFFNVGTGVQISIKELCETLLKLKNSNLEIIYKPYVGGDSRSLVKNRVGDPQKAEKLLNFKYQYSLEQGLKELIQWRSQGNQ